MKFKATKKSMKDSYQTIIGIGYCNAQHLLNYENPIAYSTRVEGWACDYYEVNGVLISTGYSHLQDKNAHCNYDLVHEYDEKASSIIHDRDYDTQKERVTALLCEFVEAATK